MLHTITKSTSQTARDKVKGSFQRFCDGTSMHGYRDLGHAKTPFWKFVWWIVLLFALGITMYQMYYATLEFMQEGSVTSVQSPEQGEVLYPPLGICYAHWLYWIDFDSAMKSGFSKEAVLYAVSFLKKIYSSERFNVTEAKKNFTETMVLNKLSRLTEFYIKFSKKFPQIVGSFPIYPRLERNPKIFTTKNIYYKSGAYYLCYTITGAEISTILKENEISSKHSRSSRTLFNFSMQDLNYNNFKMHVTYEEYNYYMAFWLCDQSNYWVITLEDFHKNYTSFTMPIRLYPDINDDQFVMLKTENEQYDILLTPTVQRVRNTKQSPCLENEKSISTDNECERRCSAQYDNLIFKCMFMDEAALYDMDTVDKLCSNPINFLNYQRDNPDFQKAPCDNFVPDGDNDTIRASGNVEPKNVKEEPAADKLSKLTANYYECTNSCNQVCEIWRYAISVSVLTGSPKVQAKTEKNQTDINLFYPDESDVLIVVNVDAQTWEGFIANVGGLLGVWTGASMISFLQVPYLCCLYETECCADRKRKKRREESVKDEYPAEKRMFRRKKKPPPRPQLVLKINDLTNGEKSEKY